MMRIIFIFLFYCFAVNNVFAVDESNQQIQYDKIIVDNQKMIEENKKIIVEEERKKEERIKEEKEQLERTKNDLLFEHFLIAPYAMFNTKFVDLSLGGQLIYLSSFFSYLVGFGVCFDYYNVIKNKYLDIPLHKKRSIIGEGYKRLYSLIFTLDTFAKRITEKGLNFAFHFGIGWQRFMVDGHNQYNSLDHEYHDSVIFRIATDLMYKRLFFRMMVDISYLPGYTKPVRSKRSGNIYIKDQIVADFSLGVGYYIF